MSGLWRQISSSVCGAAHRAANLPCQDSARVVAFHKKIPGALIACVADGAGSARCSDTGSLLACNAAVECADAYLEERGAVCGVDMNDALAWCDFARGRIDAEATSRKAEFHDFATTLCLAVVTPQGSCFMQIGDGAMVLRKHGAWGVVFWPQSGEYANSTSFITSHDYRERVQFLVIPSDFQEVALFTEGIERLALRFDTHTPYPPFFEPLFRALRAADDWSSLIHSLEQFLKSPSVAARSDDDKTLVLATYNG